LGGTRGHRRRSRTGALAVGATVAVLAGIAAGCGGGDDSANDEDRTYTASVVSDGFPARQQLGETTLMRVRVRNEGERTIPALVVSVTVGGEAGAGSSLPFGVRVGEPGLAQPDRPVWVLSESYPKRGGSDEPGGTEGASPKSFNFGPLKPGRAVEGVWQLTAVRSGDYEVLYKVDAGVAGGARLENENGTPPRGRLAVTITDQVPDQTVNDQGEVVEVREPKPAAG
jgi:hypothetical protein